MDTNTIETDKASGIYDSIRINKSSSCTRPPEEMDFELVATGNAKLQKRGSMNRSTGIVYAATGKAYLAEALTSAKTVRRLMPRFPITLFTDHKIGTGELFDEVIQITNPQHSFTDKIESLMRSPYEQTLFLDTDTYLVCNCEEIFLPLEKYDIAVALETYRDEYKCENLPACCPALNTGVIAFRQNAQVERFLGIWKEKHDGVFCKYTRSDQPAFREALYQSDLTMFILPPEYNFRTHYPNVIGGFAKVRIIHDHNPYLEQLAALLGKKTSRPTVFGPISPKHIVLWYYFKTRKWAHRRVRAAFNHR